MTSPSDRSLPAFDSVIRGLAANDDVDLRVDESGSLSPITTVWPSIAAP